MDGEGKTPGGKGFPWLARGYLCLMAAAAAAGLGLWLRAWPPPAPVGPAGAGLAAALLLLAAACQHYPVPLGPQRKRDLTIGVYFAGLPLLGAPLAVAVAGGAHLLGQATLTLRRDAVTGRRRATPRSLLFNTSQMMVTTAVGGAVYYAAQPLTAPALPEHLAGAWALPAAAGAMHLTNSGAVAVMAGLQLGRSPFGLWRSGLHVGLLPSAAPFLAGLVVVLSAAGSPWGRAAGGVLLMLLLVAVHQSLRRAQGLLAAERDARAAATVAGARAEAAARDRGEFLQVAAHELRTPLTGLRGYAELLLRQLDGHCPPDPERARRAAAIIGRQSEHLAELIAQLLDAARLETGPAGAPALDLRPVDLARLVDEAAARAGTRTGRTVHLNPTGPLWITADAPRLDRALTAVLDHALKYTPEGQPVDVALGRLPDGAATLTVHDRGPAVAPERRARLFEPHYHPDDDRHQDGTGLGLYVSRRVALAHGGTLEVEGPPAGGARFVFTLPGAPPVPPLDCGDPAGSPPAPDYHPA